MRLKRGIGIMLGACMIMSAASYQVVLADESVSAVELQTGEYSEAEIAAEWDESSASTITFEGSQITTDGSGVTVDGTTATITSGGTYVLSGTLDDGQVIVDSSDENDVILVMNNVTLHSLTSAPVYIKSAENTYITLADGTSNTVSDAEEYTTEDDISAAIYSKDDLIINGSGELTVYGNSNNGIQSKDDLKIVSGEITVQALDDAVVGKDSITIRTGNFSITAGGDAFKSTNDSDTEKGYTILDGGTYNITAGAEGFQAETTLRVNGGTFDIVTNGESAKAFKSSLELIVTGGDFTIDSFDDGMHSDGTVVISGGDIAMASGDDGIHADSDVTISGGAIDITKSYEGIEGENITISDGTIQVVASDDGINISGDSTELTDTTERVLSIQGGTITVNAEGDGLDANGSIDMSGGTVYVLGSTEGNNSAIDYDDTFTITGGVFMAAGSRGMAMAPSDTSSQASIAMVYDSVQAANTMVYAEDGDGNQIAAFMPSKEYQFVLISTPDITENDEITLYSGGTYTGDETNGVYSNGTYEGGTAVYTFAITDIVNANTELNGGGMGPGNGQRPGM